jgi:hypothetical protein
MKTIVKFNALIVILIMTTLGLNNIWAETLAIGFKYSENHNPVYGLNGFPEYFRAIPRHHDDDWIANQKFANNILPDKNLFFRAATTAYHNFYLSIFDIFSLGFSSIKPSIVSYNAIRQNQYGTEARGYGTSLRYYKIKEIKSGAGIYMSLALPTMYYKDMPFGLRPIIDAVYQTTPSELTAESGWDRYSGYESYMRIPAGNIRQHYINYGIEISSGFGNPKIDIDIGVYPRFNFYIGFTQPYTLYTGTFQYIGEKEKGEFVVSVGFQLGI